MNNFYDNEDKSTVVLSFRCALYINYLSGYTLEFRHKQIRHIMSCELLRSYDIIAY